MPLLIHQQVFYKILLQFSYLTENNKNFLFGLAHEIQASIIMAYCGRFHAPHSLSTCICVLRVCVRLWMCECIYFLPHWHLLCPDLHRCNTNSFVFFAPDAYSSVFWNASSWLNARSIHEKWLHHSAFTTAKWIYRLCNINNGSSK